MVALPGLGVAGAQLGELPVDKCSPELTLVRLLDQRQCRRRVSPCSPVLEASGEGPSREEGKAGEDPWRLSAWCEGAPTPA